jgi:phage baseplate assembly protein W
MASPSPKQQQVYYSDFLRDFNINPMTKDLARVTNEQSIINSIIKILKTNNYEVPYAPTFGANLNRFLFENFLPTTQVEMQSQITNAITAFEPRVEVLDVVVNGAPDDNSINITVTVSIINNPAPITISTVLVRVR